MKKREVRRLKRAHHNVGVKGGSWAKRQQSRMSGHKSGKRGRRSIFRSSGYNKRIR